MPPARHLHPEIETLAPDALRALQARKWVRQWAYVSESSAFYRRKLAAFVGKPLRLADLADLPLTDKEELKQSQEAAYPYGDYIACRPEQVTRIHRTSGTTGRALVLANTAADARITAAHGGRGFFASGLRPGDRVVHCLNYCLWTGGFTDHTALEATGATVIPFGVGSTRLLVETIRDLGATAISCTPSYPALLEQSLREDFSLSPRDLGLRLALFGGEPGLDNPGFRQALEARWGFGVRNANFGMSEVMSIMGSQCEATTDLHFLSGDAVFYEILDPATGRRLDVADGVSGELVCTHLEKQCQPLVRYRTRDVVTITGSAPCECGRTSFRFRVSGRTDDMFNVRGVNVFPTAIQALIAGEPDLYSGHFRIVLDGPGPYDRVEVRAETARGLAPQAWPGAARTLEQAIREGIRASATVEMLPYESLPRTAGKTSLIERR